MVGEERRGRGGERKRGRQKDRERGEVDASVKGERGEIEASVNLKGGGETERGSEKRERERGGGRKDVKERK
jgi:hypothetical protein